jgi:hypothetical protein
MKSLSWQFGLAATCAALTMFGRATPVFAAEEDRGGPADRLERLERRVNELAQRQEQMMQRLGAVLERQAPMGEPGREGFRPPMAPPGGAGIGQPMPPPQALAAAGVPAPEGLRAAAAKHLQDIAGLVKLCFLVAIVFNILVAFWIFTDIRKRGEGSDIFIALALLAGIPAAIIYSLVRIGDKRA